ncbi:hypothetical protein GCM10009636_28730 [Arthrobacter koreensis]
MGAPLAGCTDNRRNGGVLRRTHPAGPGGGEAVTFFDYAALILAAGSAVYVLAALLRPEKF